MRLSYPDFIKNGLHGEPGKLFYVFYQPGKCRYEVWLLPKDIEETVEKYELSARDRRDIAQFINGFVAPVYEGDGDLIEGYTDGWCQEGPWIDYFNALYTQAKEESRRQITAEEERKKAKDRQRQEARNALLEQFRLGETKSQDSEGFESKASLPEEESTEADTIEKNICLSEVLSLLVAGNFIKCNHSLDTQLECSCYSSVSKDRWCTACQVIHHVREGKQ